MIAMLSPSTVEPVAVRQAEILNALAADPALLKLYRAITKDLPIAELQALIARHGTSTGFQGPLKYLDCPFWIQHKLAVAVKMNLHIGAPKSILDLGMGAGHFSYVCMHLGHEVYGLDISNAVYDDLCRVLGVHTELHRIRPRQPLPRFGKRFDLVTAFASQFDFLGQGSYWSLEDWNWFIDHLMREHLTAGGRIYFRVNQAFDTKTSSYETKTVLEDVAAKFGGTFDARNSTLDISASHSS